MGEAGLHEFHPPVVMNSQFNLSSTAEYPKVYRFKNEG